MDADQLEATELQRFAELGRLSATLIHELSNPLSAALINLEASYNDSPTARRAWHNIHTLKSYVEAARRQILASGSPVAFSPGAQINHVKRLIEPLADRADVRLEFSETPRCKLFGDPIKFQQLLTNLVVNAIQAYDKTDASNRLVRVAIKLKPRELLIELRDWGKGIPIENQPKIFEPFYSTKKVGDSLGLGLAIVNQYVTDDFSGSISVESSPSAGTCFRVRLPAKA
ncbi:MAG TPA: HAMP domain-containing sensor histidine kinase [Candidatus Saccharimonadia bacterium]|nr:HAMP domain-containing sensor histidine kinase [Candidatus Saccharimonadia bacterium]